MDMIEWQWWLQPIDSGGGSGPVSGDGILLEDGVFFILLESGDYILLE